MRYTSFLVFSTLPVFWLISSATVSPFFALRTRSPDCEIIPLTFEPIILFLVNIPTPSFTLMSAARHRVMSVVCLNCAIF